MAATVNEAMLKQLKIEAEKLGFDPAQIRLEDVDVAQKGDKIRIKWGDVEIETPAPSPEAIDSWFEENGKVIAGAVVALAGVTIGLIGAVALKK